MHALSRAKSNHGEHVIKSQKKHRSCLRTEAHLISDCFTIILSPLLYSYQNPSVIFQLTVCSLLCWFHLNPVPKVQLELCKAMALNAKVVKGLPSKKTDQAAPWHRVIPIL